MDALYLPSLDQVVAVVNAETFLVFFPTVFAGLQDLVVGISADIKGLFQPFQLAVFGIYPILDVACDLHTLYIVGFM